MKNEIKFEETAARSNYCRKVYGVRKLNGYYWLSILGEGKPTEARIKKNSDAENILSAMKEKFEDRDDSCAGNDPIYQAIAAADLDCLEFLKYDNPIIAALENTIFGVR